jgi:hypothetical protein
MAVIVTMAAMATEARRLGRTPASVAVKGEGVFMLSGLREYRIASVQSYPMSILHRTKT